MILDFHLQISSYESVVAVCGPPRTDHHLPP